MITDEQIIEAMRDEMTLYEEGATVTDKTQLIRAVRRVLALQPSASAAPGWRMVPVEPTPEMLNAGADLMLNSVRQEEIAAGYQAMLSACPPPPTEEPVDEPESIETSEAEAVDPCIAKGCRYALNGEGLAPQCIVGCRRAMKEGIKK